MNWYCLRTHLGKEAKVVDSLQGKGIEHYCPMQKIDSRKLKWIQETGSGKISEPAFPSYLFFRWGNRSFDAIREINYVVQIIRGSTEKGFFPVVVPEKEIQALMAREIDGVLPTKTTYSKGDRVRLKTGGFKGYEGEIEAVKKRIYLILEGGKRVQVKHKDIEPVN